MIATVNKSGEIDLAIVLTAACLSRVVSYTVEPTIDCRDDGDYEALIVTLYDKKGKVVKAVVKK